MAITKQTKFLLFGGLGGGVAGGWMPILCNATNKKAEKSKRVSQKDR